MIGLVTCSKHPDLSDDDRPLLKALRTLGLDCAPAVWDKPDVRWSDYRALVLRSTWNYHTHPRKFTEWLRALEARDVPLWNPVPVVRWNMHKRYLRELEGQGILVPPTEWVARGDPRPLRTLLATRGWTDAIVKPAISASATDTWRTTGNVMEDDRRFAELAWRRDVLVQPTIAEVASDGEWSLMYLGGAFSHAMRKRPRAGDFRVQAEHGGTSAREEPPAGIVAAGGAIVAKIPGDWLYARVDGVATGAGFMLMELELIEPVLFLGEKGGAVEQLASAIAARAPSTY